MNESLQQIWTGIDGLVSKSNLLKRELEEGSVYRALFPYGVAPGGLCEPNRQYLLAPRTPGCDGPGLRFYPGMRLMRLMTHPADARAGWAVEAHSMKFSYDPISPFQDETPFSAFHWVLSRVKLPWEGYEILMEVDLQARVVLRAPEPRPMTHGLWVKVYDPRFRVGLSSPAAWGRRLVVQPTPAGRGHLVPGRIR